MITVMIMNDDNDDAWFDLIWFDLIWFDLVIVVVGVAYFVRFVAGRWRCCCCCLSRCAGSSSTTSAAWALFLLFVVAAAAARADQDAVVAELEQLIVIDAAAIASSSGVVVVCCRVAVVHHGHWCFTGRSGNCSRGQTDSVVVIMIIRCGCGRSSRSCLCENHENQAFKWMKRKEKNKWMN